MFLLKHSIICGHRGDPLIFETLNFADVTFKATVYDIVSEETVMFNDYDMVMIIMVYVLC